MVERTQRYDPKTIVCVFSVDLRARIFSHDFRHRQRRVRRRTAKLYSIVSRRIVILEKTMQKRSMGGIDANFERLEPVARDMSLESEGVGVGRDETIKVRKRRRLAGSQIGEQDAVAFANRISLVPNLGVKSAPFRLGRRLETFPADVKQPSVERAAQPSVFEPSEGQVRAAMRTGAVDQSVAALLVAKQHQVLTKELDRLDRPLRRQFFKQRGRLPVKPH